MRPCWSCGAQNMDCYGVCECAKCIDPIGYQEWKETCPEEYEAWLERQRDDY